MSVSVTPTTLNVFQGATATATVNVTRDNYTAAVTLTDSLTPSGVTVSFQPAGAEWEHAFEHSNGDRRGDGNARSDRRGRSRRWAGCRRGPRGSWGPDLGPATTGEGVAGGDGNGDRHVEPRGDQLWQRVHGHYSRRERTSR